MRSVFYSAFGYNLGAERHTGRALRICEFILLAEGRLLLSVRGNELNVMRAKAQECIPVLLRGFREGRFRFGEISTRLANVVEPSSLAEVKEHLKTRRLFQMKA